MSQPSKKQKLDQDVFLSTEHHFYIPAKDDMNSRKQYIDYILRLIRKAYNNSNTPYKFFFENQTSSLDSKSLVNIISLAQKKIDVSNFFLYPFSEAKTNCDKYITLYLHDTNSFSYPQNNHAFTHYIFPDLESYKGMVKNEQEVRESLPICLFFHILSDLDKVQSSSNKAICPKSIFKLKQSFSLGSSYNWYPGKYLDDYVKKLEKKDSPLKSIPTNDQELYRLFTRMSKFISRHEVTHMAYIPFILIKGICTNESKDITQYLDTNEKKEAYKKLVEYEKDCMLHELEENEKEDISPTFLQTQLFAHICEELGYGIVVHKHNMKSSENYCRNQRGTAWTKLDLFQFAEKMAYREDTTSFSLMDAIDFFLDALRLESIYPF